MGGAEAWVCCVVRWPGERWFSPLRWQASKRQPPLCWRSRARLRRTRFEPENRGEISLEEVRGGRACEVGNSSLRMTVPRDRRECVGSLR